MWNKLKSLIDEMELLNYEELSKEEKEKIKTNLLIKISFFQHERLIHLIVTVCFALLSLINIIVIYVSENLIAIILEALFIGLLIPYIVHYYRLENGVQKLYEYFDRIKE